MLRDGTICKFVDPICTENKFVIIGSCLFVDIMYSLLQDFTGNTDINTVVTNFFPDPVVADAIRILPTTWERFIIIRMEILGCLVPIQHVNGESCVDGIGS